MKAGSQGGFKFLVPEHSKLIKVWLYACSGNDDDHPQKHSRLFTFSKPAEHDKPRE